MTNVIVMAQGQQQRIGHMLGTGGLPAWKHLLKVSESDSILSRTCKLFQAAGAEIVVPVIHWHHEMVNLCMDMTVPFVIQRDPGASVLNGIYNIRELWGSKTVIALGDVVYSKETVRRMMSETKFCMYWRPGPNRETGNPFPERFGLCFERKNHHDLVMVLEVSSFRNHGDHKLSSLVEPLSGAMEMVEVSDYTDDIDTEQAFREWFPKLKEAAARDV
jgi:hypothetical protein